MVDENVIYCRAVWKETKKVVDQHTTPSQRKKSYVWHVTSFKCWEFHAFDGFYWSGQAHNAFDARVKGWEAWLRHKEVEGYK